MTEKSKTAATMEGLGLTKCDGCGDWCNDVVPCVREVHISADSGTGWAGHDVPQRVGDLCGECQREEGAMPEADF